MGEESKKATASREQAELFAAIAAGNLEKVRELVERDKELVNSWSHAGQSALEFAAEHSSWERPKLAEIVQFLIAQGARCDIFTAAGAGLLEQAGALLDENPSLLEAQDSLGRTPLQCAALKGSVCEPCEAAVDFLISRGAKVDIFTACAFGMLELVRSWVEKDRRLIHARCQGATPLLWAVRPRRNASAALEICKLLAESRADLNAEDTAANNMTVLHHAVEWGNAPELVQFLVARGAEPNARDDRGWTPLDYANDRKQREIAAFLRSRGAKATTAEAGSKFGAQAREMIAAAQRGDLAALAALLREDPGLVHTRGPCGETPLHWAAYHGRHVIAELLLKHGADVHSEATSKWGGTPLAWAAERQPEMVELLHAHGASVNAADSTTGQTPLHFCARGANSGEIAEFLAAHGAEINARDNSGRTALQYARYYENQAVATVLRRRGAKKQA